MRFSLFPGQFQSSICLSQVWIETENSIEKLEVEKVVWVYSQRNPRLLNSYHCSLYNKIDYFIKYAITTLGSINICKTSEILEKYSLPKIPQIEEYNNCSDRSKIMTWLSKQRNMTTDVRSGYFLFLFFSHNGTAYIWCKENRNSKICMNEERTTGFFFLSFFFFSQFHSIQSGITAAVAWKVPWLSLITWTEITI